MFSQVTVHQQLSNKIKKLQDGVAKPWENISQLHIDAYTPKEEEKHYTSIKTLLTQYDEFEYIDQLSAAFFTIKKYWLTINPELIKSNQACYDGYLLALRLMEIHFLESYIRQLSERTLLPELEEKKSADDDVSNLSQSFDDIRADCEKQFIEGVFGSYSLNRDVEIQLQDFNARIFDYENQIKANSQILEDDKKNHLPSKIQFAFQEEKKLIEQCQTLNRFKEEYQLLSQKQITSFDQIMEEAKQNSQNIQLKLDVTKTTKIKKLTQQLSHAGRLIDQQQKKYFLKPNQIVMTNRLNNLFHFGYSHAVGLKEKEHLTLASIDPNVLYIRNNRNHVSIYYLDKNDINCKKFMMTELVSIKGSLPKTDQVIFQQSLIKTITNKCGLSNGLNASITQFQSDNTGFFTWRSANEKAAVIMMSSALIESYNTLRTSPVIFKDKIELSAAKKQLGILISSKKQIEKDISEKIEKLQKQIEIQFTEAELSILKESIFKEQQQKLISHSTTLQIVKDELSLFLEQRKIALQAIWRSIIETTDGPQQVKAYLASFHQSFSPVDTLMSTNVSAMLILFPKKKILTDQPVKVVTPPPVTAITLLQDDALPKQNPSKKWYQRLTDKSWKQAILVGLLALAGLVFALTLWGFIAELSVFAVMSSVGGAFGLGLLAGMSVIFAELSYFSMKSSCHSLCQPKAPTSPLGPDFHLVGSNADRLMNAHAISHSPVTSLNVGQENYQYHVFAREPKDQKEVSEENQQHHWTFSKP